MNTTIQHKAWADIPAASKTVLSGERYVITHNGLIAWNGASDEETAGQAELAAIAQAYPERDSHGYVLGFYNYTPQGDRASGPHPNVTEAVEAKRGLGIGPYNMVCGHVFTSRGTIIKES